MFGKMGIGFSSQVAIMMNLLSSALLWFLKCALKKWTASMAYIVFSTQVVLLALSDIE